MSQGKKNKDKGRNAEYRVVKIAESAGHKAIRAWCSNGKALGQTEETDVMVGDRRVQVKSRKSVADYLIKDLDNEVADVVVLEKSDKKPYRHYAIIPFDKYLEFIK